jgi:hypothetical protein
MMMTYHKRGQRPPTKTRPPRKCSGEGGGVHHFSDPARRHLCIHCVGKQAVTTIKRRRHIGPRKNPVTLRCACRGWLRHIGGDLMKVDNWETFPDKLCEALIQAYPDLTWRTELQLSIPNEVSMVVVCARRSGRDVEVRVPRHIIENDPLASLVDEIHKNAEQLLAL